MESEQKPVVYHACRKVLRPFASMLLKCGMTWKEFSDLSKTVFVQAATEEFGIKGRPTNVSRASILTGISRKEVKRQRDLLDGAVPAAKGKTTDATKVLSGWFQDPDYVDENSNPRLLKETGPKPSFETLCGQFGGDIAMPTMLKELLNTETIERTEDGYLRAKRRYYQPAMHDDEMLLNAVSRIYDLTKTVNNNVFPGKNRIPRFGGAAENDCMPVSAIPKFKKFLDERGQAFLEEVDDWLSKHAVSNTSDKPQCVRIGVGMFAIEDRDSMENQK